MSFGSISQLIKKLLAMFTALSLLIAGIGLGVSEGELVETDIKNVIYLIGDGMGENHLEKTKAETGLDLYMETLPLRGQVQTNDYFGGVTDSAAAGTALACGVRTLSGSIGVYVTDLLAFESYPMNLSELAIELGMKTGIVVSDSTTGATPAAFSAHTNSRDNKNAITDQQLSSGIDIIWGANESVATVEKADALGYEYLDDYDDVLALTGDEKSFGQFTNNVWSLAGGESFPTLSLLTEKAIELLDNDDGFFLMVEGAHIDKHSHSNNDADMIESLLEFDKAVEIAMDFAQENGNTLVVVTADHETGAIKNIDGSYQFTSGSHSNADVPLLVYGSEDFISQGEVIKNRDVPVRIAKELGAENIFPRNIKK